LGYILLLGGARSGKSATAQHLALRSGAPVTVIATAEPGDEEMAERIRQHRASRPSEWRTIESPRELLGAVTSAPAGDFVVVDCLTLWVSNLLLNGVEEPVIQQAARDVAEALEARRGVVVSNEVGMGVHPSSDVGRRFRDALGSVNATFAGSAQQTLLMVAGQALALTSVDRALQVE
jgi:adenosyl cobinamide kinase/adenosyl cobinamide phosphate guanylyltransferase